MLGIVIGLLTRPASRWAQNETGGVSMSVLAARAGGPLLMPTFSPPWRMDREGAGHHRSDEFQPRRLQSGLTPRVSNNFCAKPFGCRFLKGSDFSRDSRQFRARGRQERNLVENSISHKAMTLQPRDGSSHNLFKHICWQYEWKECYAFRHTCCTDISD